MSMESSKVKTSIAGFICLIFTMLIGILVILTWIYMFTDFESILARMVIISIAIGKMIGVLLVGLFIVILFSLIIFLITHLFGKEFSFNGFGLYFDFTGKKKSRT